MYFYYKRSGKLKEFTINSNDCGQRLDKFLSKALPDLPKSMLHKLIRKKEIKVNGKRCDASEVLKEGATVKVFAKDEFLRAKNNRPPITYSPSVTHSNLEITYEDENIIVINKPIGLVVHCDDKHENNTLINQVIGYLIEKGEFSPSSEVSFSPALCNRLDKNTCGLVIAAKNSAALREINNAIKSHKILKTYMCITVNELPEKTETLIAYHKTINEGNMVDIKNSEAEGYKKIISEYEVISSKPPLNLVKVNLITGRKHQIRAHLAHIGSPLLGDMKYGDKKINKAHKCFFQALCAFRLKFNFDKDSSLEYLNPLNIECAIPDSFKIILNGK